MCHKPHPIRPERAEAPSPGQRPGSIYQQQSRPVRAKALNMRSFCPYRATLLLIYRPRVLPWARSFCPFRAYGMWFMTHPLFKIHFILFSPASSFVSSLVSTSAATLVLVSAVIAVLAIVVIGIEIRIETLFLLVLEEAGTLLFLIA